MTVGPVVSTGRVLIVDDQPAFHDVAHDLIDHTAGFKWVGGAGSGEQAVEDVERLRPDLVLMDIRMPGIGGIEAGRQIASRGSPALVILISADEPPEEITGAGEGHIIRKHKLSPTLLRHLWASRPA